MLLFHSYFLILSNRRQLSVKFSTSIGFLAGPLFGSALFSLGGFVLPFFFFSGCSFALGVILYFLSHNLQIDAPELNQDIIVYSSIETESIIDPEFQISYVSLIFNYPVAISFIMNMLTLSVWTFYYPVFALYLNEQYQIDESYSGYYFSINAASFGISSFAIAQIKENKKFWMFFGFVFSGLLQFYMGPDFLFTHLHPTFSYTIMAWTLAGFTGGFPYILLLPEVNQILKKDYYKYPIQCSNVASAMQKMINSRFNSSLAGGELIGPIAGGYLVNLYGFPRAASILGITILVVAVCYIPYLFMLDKEQRRKRNIIEFRE